jgi:hypothetical protein
MATCKALFAKERSQPLVEGVRLFGSDILLASGACWATGVLVVNRHFHQYAALIEQLQ